MKTLKNIALALVIATSASVVGLAQTKEISHDLSEFDGINVSNAFKVSLGSASAGTYGVKLNVTDALETYVQCYVKAKTLYITVDEKSYSKDLKKELKSKNSSDPVLNAVIYLPELNSITLSDDATFTTTSKLNSSKFSIDLSGNSSISSHFDVSASTASVKLAKKSKIASMNVSADELTVSADGDATATIEFDVDNLEVDSNGSAVLTLKGDAGNVVVSTDKSAKTTVSGKATTLKAQGGSGTIEAGSLNVTDAAVAVIGATVKVNASNTLSLDLGKGSEVNFVGEPVITIKDIQKSTVTTGTK